MNASWFGGSVKGTVSKEEKQLNYRKRKKEEDGKTRHRKIR
jgi:hypothetical protein